VANSTITLANPDLATSPVTVTITGTGVAPTLTATTTPATTPTSIAFGNVTTLTTSGAQIFTLTGANLTASTTLTTAAPFTLSVDGGTTYGITATITAATLAAPQNILVKYSPTAAGASTGTVSIASTGVTTQTVALTGTGVIGVVPTFTLNTNVLTFNTLVGSTSPFQSYTIVGTNITGASSVTVATPYTISTSSTGVYGSTINYTTADFPGGTGIKTIYVQFSPTVVATGGVNNGSAVNFTTGGTNQTVILNGTGVGVPVLTASPTSLTFSGVINTSSTLPYTLSGVYITANTVLTATGPYTISKDGTTFASTLTYTPADMALPQTVTVKFSPTVIGGNNGTITNASAGAVTQTVTLNGTGLGVPALTAAPTGLTFIQGSGTASAAQNFIITGANITAGVTLTTGAPYTISKTSTGGYGTTLSYAATDLATPQTVYVIFTPTAIGAANGTVAVASSGAISQTVTLNGTGINSSPTLAAISDIALCYTSTAQTVALTGISAGESTQTTIVSATSDNPGLFSQFGVLPLTSATAQINYTVLPGASGVANVTVTVKDNGGTANGGIDTYTRTFKITVNALAIVSITSDATGNVVTKGSNVTLTATGGTTYSWTADATIISSLTNASVTIRPSATTTYTVTATNATGCTTTKTITIQVVLAKTLETSNVITPNGDGKNDYWVIRNIDLYPANNVKVYDKAGKLVYSKTGYNNDWNGYYNGSPLVQGTYIYVVDLGTGIPYKGVISIVRD